MKYVYLSLSLMFLMLISPDAYGQLEKLIKDDDITWIAETNIEYFFEQERNVNFNWSGTKIAGINTSVDVSTIKMDDLKDRKTGNFANLDLTIKIINAALDGQFKVYDLASEEKLSHEDIIDRLTVSDSFNYHAIRYNRNRYHQVEPLGFNYWDVKSFIVKQYWYYDESKDRMYSLVHEMIPVIWIKKVYNEIIKKETFRIRFDLKSGIKRPLDINDEDNIWIKRSTEQIGIDLFSTALKGNTGAFLKKKMWEEPMMENHEIYSANQALCGLNICNFDKKEELLTTSERAFFLNDRTDTVEIIMPETYGDIPMRIVHNHAYNADDILGIETNQIWVYDDRKKIFYSYLKSVAPLFINEKWKYTMDSRRELMKIFVFKY